MNWQFPTQDRDLAPSHPSPKQLGSLNWREELNRQIQSLLGSNSQGLLYEMASVQMQHPGKFLRPHLAWQLGKCLVDESLCQPEFVVAWAACIETLHNATLVHDDLQDRDVFRRGRPTIWKLYGDAQAINLGDFLMTLAPQFFLVSQMSDNTKVSLSLIFSKMVAALVNGQSSELELNKLGQTQDLESHYLRVVGGKTAALFSYLAQGVAIISKQNSSLQARLGEILFELGHIFQMQDDILDLYGDKKREAFGCDIREGKVSCLVVKHWISHPEDRQWLQEILLRPRHLTLDVDVLGVMQKFVAKGTLQKCLEAVSQRTLALRAEPLLQENKALGDFIEESLQSIFQPIRHLYGLQNEF